MTKSNIALNPNLDVSQVGGISDLISFKLARLTTLNDRIAQRLISDRFGLSLREFRTVATIDYLGSATTAVLARESFLDHAQISRIVAGLIKRGLVERLGSVGRGGALQLTQAGKTLMRVGVSFASHHNDRLIAELSPEDRTSLFRLMDLMLHSAQERYAEVNGEISDLARGFGGASATARKGSAPAT